MLRALRYVIRYLWVLPATLVGLALALLALGLGASLRCVDGTLEVGGGRLHRWIMKLPRGMRFEAITLGHVIVGRSHAVLAEVRLHEQVHVRQYERWGPLFLPLYLGSSLWQWLRGKDPYLDNCFEREAFEAERATPPRPRA